MRISDWSSDVCSSDLADAVVDRLDSEAPGVDLARRWKRKRVRTIIVVDPSGATCSARGRDVAPWPVGRCGAGLLLPPRPRKGGVADRYAKAYFRHPDKDHPGGRSRGHALHPAHPDHGAAIHRALPHPGVTAER